MNAPSKSVVFALLALIAAATPPAQAQPTNPQARISVDIAETNLTFSEPGEEREVSFRVNLTLGNTACAQSTKVPVTIAIREEPGYEEVRSAGPSAHNFSIAAGF